MLNTGGLFMQLCLLWRTKIGVFKRGWFIATATIHKFVLVTVCLGFTVECFAFTTNTATGDSKWETWLIFVINWTNRWRTQENTLLSLDDYVLCQSYYCLDVQDKSVPSAFSAFQQLFCLRWQRIIC